MKGRPEAVGLAAVVAGAISGPRVMRQVAACPRCMGQAGNLNEAGSLEGIDLGRVRSSFDLPPRPPGARRQSPKRVSGGPAVVRFLATLGGRRAENRVWVLAFFRAPESLNQDSSPCCGERSVLVERASKSDSLFVWYVQVRRHSKAGVITYGRSPKSEPCSQAPECLPGAPESRPTWRRLDFGQAGAQGPPAWSVAPSQVAVAASPAPPGARGFARRRRSPEVGESGRAGLGDTAAHGRPLQREPLRAAPLKPAAPPLRPAPRRERSARGKVAARRRSMLSLGLDTVAASAAVSLTRGGKHDI